MPHEGGGEFVIRIEFPNEGGEVLRHYLIARTKSRAHVDICIPRILYNVILEDLIANPALYATRLLSLDVLSADIILRYSFTLKLVVAGENSATIFRVATRRSLTIGMRFFMRRDQLKLRLFDTLILENERKYAVSGVGVIAPRSSLLVLHGYDY
ncbi:hypothetical protein BPAE_0143g00040 [Botrytis paeoniae]|uniref:Uncharacterized protein n=1 Tax=Botrytis paeoniae TaxID=278948 RepID=A0A4Z1FN63_9HELO|nr:hypothetical protein BPAE_0143g00040 [Botrytis paeoniae]